MASIRMFPEDTVFVTTDDIHRNLSDFHIFDARYNVKNKDYGAIEYAKGHARHAVWVNVDTELCGPLTNTTARHPLPSAEQFMEWAKSRGIAQGRPVLIYDDDCGGMGGCRLWWMLDSLGVEAYVLNGGIQAYHAAGLPMEKGEQQARVAPATFWPFRTAFQHHVCESEISPNAFLADTRAASRFSSTVRPYGMDTVPGHIDGAVNIPYQSLLIEVNDVKKLRDFDEIRSNMLKALNGAWSSPGAPDFSKCIFYCGSGVSACINIALARHLGLGQPYLYCGSWSEYAGIHRFPLLRQTISSHGMWMEMQTAASLADGPRVNTDVNIVSVDGDACAVLDDEVKAAVAHLHVGERARVFFKSGRTAIIEVPLKL